MPQLHLRILDPSEGEYTFDAAAASIPYNTVAAQQGLARKGAPLPGAMTTARDKTGPLIAAMSEATEEAEEEDGFDDDDAPTPLSNIANFD